MWMFNLSNSTQFHFVLNVSWHSIQDGIMGDASLKRIINPCFHVQERINVKKKGDQPIAHRSIEEILGRKLLLLRKPSMFRSIRTYCMRFHDMNQWWSGYARGRLWCAMFSWDNEDGNGIRIRRSSVIGGREGFLGTIHSQEGRQNGLDRLWHSMARRKGPWTNVGIYFLFSMSRIGQILTTPPSHCRHHLYMTPKEAHRTQKGEGRLDDAHATMDPLTAD